MGCFNGTCGVTQLPILHGDDVVVFILKHEAWRGDGLNEGLCNSDALCSPIFMPFRAEYNDYGGIENAKVDSNTKLILDWANTSLNKSLTLDFKEIAAKKEDNERAIKAGRKPDEYTRHEKVEKFDAIEDFFEAIERGRVTISGSGYTSINGDKLVYVTYMMVRADIFDKLCSATAANRDANIRRMDSYYEREYTNKGKELPDYVKKDVVAAKLGFVERLNQDAELLLKFITTKVEEQKNDEYAYEDPWGRTDVDSAVPDDYNLISGHMVGDQGFSRREYWHALKARFASGEISEGNDAWNETKKAMVDYAIFNKAFIMLRKLYIPQAGAGSQNQDFELYSDLATITRDVANGVLEKQREENGNDE